MKIIKEFKEFAIKGNMIDLTVGVILGGAFGKITASLVNDIIMPLISLITGGINFKDLKIILSRSADNAPAITWNYGNFIQLTIEFLIIAFAIFIMIKMMNKLKRQERTEAPAPAAPRQEILLTEIRDLLKKV
ncbi:MAG: large-conductance mechanosensitive channel protein MscL [Patescibacteria group bacterium]|nr:large-conductance mechanosensitive channel protein MscL [Patescibacteria group bacterium]